MNNSKFKYIHWLKIDFTNETKNGIEWNNLKKYKENYDCNMSVFYYNNNPFLAKIIKLECNQSYNDLDLDVNSMFDGSLIRLKNKPKNISPYNKNIDMFFQKNIKNIDNNIMEL